MSKVLAKVWRGWLKFAEVVGNVQMIVLLSIIYWTMLLVLAVPFKFLSDPLGLKRGRVFRWVSREPVSDVLESMRKQG